MDIEVIAEDEFGGESYRNLFGEIMADVGKAVQMEKALLVLKPEIPLFIFSVKLRAEPVSKTVADVTNIRTEGGTVYITITEERYAPDILKGLWARYGRNSVEQKTRLDIEVRNASEKDAGSLVVASGEEHLKEIIGAVWRSMPEGIKNRHTFIDGQVITVVATEERFEPHMLDEGSEYHRKMTEAGKDV
ncbi:MAG: methanogenesis marker 17 protein [Candidatus Methanoplasma sp.]|jgi:putative methanogenesis marker protein 17|nr:methanogenesis marker 17 protein [Candidatus Methanoplasma sp.]